MLRKSLVYLLALTLLFFVAGCGSTDTTTDETNVDEEVTTDLSEEILGSWETTKGDVTETFTFDKNGTFEVVVKTEADGEVKSESNQTGTYALEDDELTLVADDTEATASEENPDEAVTVDNEMLGIANEPFTAKITIDGDTLTLDGGDTGTYEFTKVDA